MPENVLRTIVENVLETLPLLEIVRPIKIVNNYFILSEFSSFMDNY